MIDGKRIKENLKLFSFPRLSGTEGEKKAFSLALDKIKELNVKAQTQEFTYSTYYANYYPKVLIFISFNLLLLFYLNLISIIVPILYFIYLVILVIHLFLTKKPESIKLGKKVNSQNIIIKLQTNSSKNNIKEYPERNFLFFCHLDSKSQRFSILTRIRAAKLWVNSSIFLVILVIFKNYILVDYSLVFYLIGLFPLVINLLTTILVLLNSTGNESQGSIDNASGIVCILELLYYYLDPKGRSDNISYWFIFTGAEERGTMGIRYFYEKIKHLERKNSIIFNFDAIGTGITLFPGKGYNENIKTLLGKFLNFDDILNLNIHSKRFYVGSSSDGYYLKKKGFQGFGIGDKNSYKYIHSVNDTVDKIDSSILKKLCNTIIKILKDYETNF